MDKPRDASRLCEGTFILKRKNRKDVGQMIIIMKPRATKEQLNKVIQRVEAEGLTYQLNQGSEQVVLGLIGDTRSIQDVAFLSYEGVEKTMRISNTYKLTSREFHPQDTVVDVDGVKIGDGSFVTMAGPCSIEGLEQIRETARITEDRRELSEDAAVELNYKISLLQQEQAGVKKIKVIYFRQDTTKDGGAYREEDGDFKRIKSSEGILELTNVIQIPLEDIFKIEIV